MDQKGCYDVVTKVWVGTRGGVTDAEEGEMRETFWRMGCLMRKTWWRLGGLKM